MEAEKRKAANAELTHKLIKICSHTSCLYSLTFLPLIYLLLESDRHIVLINPCPICNLIDFIIDLATNF